MSLAFPDQRRSVALAPPEEFTSFHWIAWSAQALLLAAVLLGIKQFEIWDSVRQFIDYDPWLYLNTPFHELSANAWWIRTGLVLPSLIVSEFTPITRDLSFGIYATIVVLLTVRACTQTQDEVLGASPIRTLGTTLFLLGLSLCMNGRICFAVLGAAWLYRAHFRWFRGDTGTMALAVANLLSLILMTVSTGAFYVGISIVMAATFLGMRDPRPGPAQGQLTLNTIIASIPSLLLVIHQATLFNEKLSRWHDGDYLMIVYHGPLRLIEEYIPSVPPELLLCGISVGGVCVGVFWLGYASSFPIANTYLTTTVMFGLLCGAFGWSTLLTNLPGYVLMAWVFLAPQQSNTVSLTPERRNV